MEIIEYLFNDIKFRMNDSYIEVFREYKDPDITSFFKLIYSLRIVISWFSKHNRKGPNKLLISDIESCELSTDKKVFIFNRKSAFRPEVRFYAPSENPDLMLEKIRARIALVKSSK